MTTVDSATSQQQTTVSSASQNGAASGDSGSTTKTGSNFESFLEEILNAGGKSNLSEEELFAGVVEARLKDLKGDEAAAKFQTSLEARLASGTGPHGYFSFEDGAKDVLTELTGDGTLTQDESNSLYSDSFNAAQLDDKLDALFDDKGGPGDITISTAAVSEAISSAVAAMESAISGKSLGSARLLSEASTGWSYKLGGSASGAVTGSAAGGSTVSATNVPDGQTFDGSGEFLFKPVSNNEGTLAVILPQALLGRVTSVDLKAADGSIIESGRFTSSGDNGTNEKYSFSKEGGEYPADLTVSITLNDGSVVTYSIPDPSQRYD